MKKLLFIFFLLPLYSTAQTAAAYIQSGNTKAGAKNYQDAIADFTKAIQLNSTDPQGYFYRANAYSNM